MLKDKIKIIKASREKLLMHKVTSIRANFSLNTVKTRRLWGGTFQVWKEKTRAVNNSISSKRTFQKWRQMTFTDKPKQNLLLAETRNTNGSSSDRKQETPESN